MIFYTTKLIKHIECDDIVICGDLNDWFGNLPILTTVRLYVEADYNGNGNE
jgi:hypothetical protein